MQKIFSLCPGMYPQGSVQVPGAYVSALQSWKKYKQSCLYAEKALSQVAEALQGMSCSMSRHVHSKLLVGKPKLLKVTSTFICNQWALHDPLLAVQHNHIQVSRWLTI